MSLRVIYLYIDHPDNQGFAVVKKRIGAGCLKEIIIKSLN